MTHVRDIENLLKGRPLRIASDRGPVMYLPDDDNGLVAVRGRGGLVTALAPINQISEAEWFFSGTTQEMRIPADGLSREIELPSLPGQRARLQPVHLQPRVYEPFYNVACTALWLLHHQMFPERETPEYTGRFVDAWHAGYLPVNEAFARALVTEAGKQAWPPLLLIQDIHLYLVPKLVREKLSGAKILHFIHPPWPGASWWRVLPADVRQSIFESLLQVDILGLQTKRDVQNFLECAAAFVPGARADSEGNVVEYAGHKVNVRDYPVAVDEGELNSIADSAKSKDHRTRLSALCGERTIVRVDRVDPIKNIPNGFRAYARLLELHPELHTKVNFLAFLVPGPSDIPEYAACKREIDQTSEAVNASFGRRDWRPVTVFCEDNIHQSIAALQIYDVLLVNPVTDGMNLVAKEGSYLNKKNGVLVISNTAGAYEQLKDGVVPVSPNDIDGTANALYRALTMAADERMKRSTFLREEVAGQDAASWLFRQVADLCETS